MKKNSDMMSTLNQSNGCKHNSSAVSKIFYSRLSIFLVSNIKIIVCFLFHKKKMVLINKIKLFKILFFLKIKIKIMILVKNDGYWVGLAPLGPNPMPVGPDVGSGLALAGFNLDRIGSARFQAGSTRFKFVRLDFDPVQIESRSVQLRSKSVQWI